MKSMVIPDLPDDVDFQTEEMAEDAEKYVTAAMIDLEAERFSAELDDRAWMSALADEYERGHQW
jgi:hypothetical protein